MASGDSSVPEKFFGRFIQEKSENFDKFIASKGLYWLMDKRISIEKVITKNEEPGKYNLDNLATKKNTTYRGWKLGMTFEDEGLDGKRHNITFDMVNDVLTEKHVRLGDSKDKGETYYYTIDNDNKLVLEMHGNGIVCRRWFKREAPKN